MGQSADWRVLNTWVRAPTISAPPFMSNRTSSAGTGPHISTVGDGSTGAVATPDEPPLWPAARQNSSSRTGKRRGKPIVARAACASSHAAASPTHVSNPAATGRKRALKCHLSYMVGKRRGRGQETWLSKSVDLFLFLFARSSINHHTLKGVPCIHLVAVHFSPRVTGQEACSAAWSSFPSTLVLQNRMASPVCGLTDGPRWAHCKEGKGGTASDVRMKWRDQPERQLKSHTCE